MDRVRIGIVGVGNGQAQRDGLGGDAALHGR
jgi:hypothetical protein